MDSTTAISRKMELTGEQSPQKLKDDISARQIMVRNTNDLSASDMTRFRKVEKAFLKYCRLFGFHEIKTSTIESLHTLTGSNSLAPSALKRIISFLDRGEYTGEKIAFKPDSTISAARWHMENDPGKNKIYYVENQFLRDKNHKISERWQMGVETYNEDNYLADFEIIYLAANTLYSVGVLSTRLTLSYPSILIDLIKSRLRKSGYSNGETHNILELLSEDKPDFLKETQLSSDIKEHIFRMIYFKSSNRVFLKNLRHELHEPEDAEIIDKLKRFEKVCELLDQVEIPYEIKFGAPINLAYYTGVRFNIIGNSDKNDILCGGGRYNKLFARLGRNMKESISGAGCALYVNNIIRNIQITVNKQENIGVIVGDINKKNINKAQRLSDKLNKLGFTTRIFLDDLEETLYSDYGLILKVDYEKYEDGYRVAHNKEIGKALLKNIFSEPG